MSETHHCGPDHDKEFFADLSKVWQRHPKQAKKYRVSCCDHETDIMKVDFGKRVAKKRIEGKRIITEFVEAGLQGDICCDWCHTDAGYRCCGFWVEDGGGGLTP